MKLKFSIFLISCLLFIAGIGFAQHASLRNEDALKYVDHILVLTITDMCSLEQMFLTE